MSDPHNCPSSVEPAHLAHPKYRPDIDGLRAIAILAVVGFHAFPFWIKGGFIGVDVFFVISGFLISNIIFRSLSKGVFSFREFYARRIRRIFPALVLVLLACYAFGWVALLADEYKQFGKHMAAGAGFLSNFFFWQESGYFDNAAGTKPLLHLWSLGIEEQFYIVWPLLLYLAWKRRFNVLSIVIAIIVASFVVNVHTVYYDRVQAFYSPVSRFWELLIGSILAYIQLHQIKGFDRAKQRVDAVLGKIIYSPPPMQNGAVLRDTQSLLGALLIGIAVFFFAREESFPGWWALLPTIGTYFIISAGPHAWFNRGVLSHPVMVWFGLVSYPLYLWHWPLLSFARIIEGTTPSREMRVSVVLLSVILAGLTYRFIEKPIRFGRHNKTLIVSVLCLLMIVIGSVGYNTYKRDGLTFRVAAAGLADSFTFKFVEDCDSFGWKGGLCRFVDGPSRSHVVLLGDSFANSYSSFLMSSKKNYRNFTFTQAGLGLCPLLLGFGPPECADAADKIFNVIKSNENVKTVFIASNFKWYTNGEALAYYKLKSKSPEELAVALNTTSPEAFNAALIRTVSEYRKLGKQVTILLTPPYGRNPKECAPRLFKVAKCDFPRPKDIEKSNKQIMALWEKGMQPVFFDPFLYLCDATTCFLTNGRSDIYYIDSWHLGVKGGEFLAESGRQDFARLLNSGTGEQCHD